MGPFGETMAKKEVAQDTVGLVNTSDLRALVDDTRRQTAERIVAIIEQNRRNIDERPEDIIRREFGLEKP